MTDNRLVFANMKNAIEMLADANSAPLLEDAGTLLRPASARRIGNLRALVAEFAERDIGGAGAALFLGCSLTAARNYISELLDAGVVAARPVREAAGCVDRTLYHRTTDPLVVHRFLAALAKPRGGNGMPAPRGARGVEARPDGSHVHRVWHDAALPLAMSNAPARRDPLVTALFGAPALRKEHCS
jgi:hypothetical protein